MTSVLPVRFWEDIIHHNGSATIAGQGVPRNDAPGRMMLSFATSLPANARDPRGGITKLHLARVASHSARRARRLQRLRTLTAARLSLGAWRWATSSAESAAKPLPSPLHHSVIARRQTRGPLTHGVSRSILAQPFIFEPAFCAVHGTVNNREFAGASTRLLTKRREAEERSKKPPAFAKTKKLKQLRTLEATSRIQAHLRAKPHAVRLLRSISDGAQTVCLGSVLTVESG